MILIILMLVWKKHLNIWGSWVKSTPFATILCLKNKKVHQSSYFAFFFAKKQASLLHAKAADSRRVAATRGGWPGLECKLASWAEDGRIHFISSNLEFRVKVLPAVFCRSPTHTLTLAISVSSQVTPKVCQFTLLLPSSQSSRPRTLPSPLHCPAPVPQRLLPGVRPCLAVSVTTSHMYLSPPCNVLEGFAKGLLTLLCPPSTHQCLRR